MNSETILAKAKEVLSIEIEGLEAIRNSLGEDFVKLVQACAKTLDSGAKIIISGLGKSGHVGSKNTVGRCNSEVRLLAVTDRLRGEAILPLGSAKSRDIPWNSPS